MMNEQTQKTAVALVDEIININPGRSNCVHVAWIKQYGERIKSAIEREQAEQQEVAYQQEEQITDQAKTIKHMNEKLASAITLRPISELPDKVPEECVIVAMNSVHTWMWFTGEKIPHEWLNESNVDSIPNVFCFVPRPMPERKLKPCPFCGSSGKPYWAIGCAPGCWWVICNKCRAIGPRKSTETKAKEAWGWE
jgi:hypothetical protein